MKQLSPGLFQALMPTIFFLCVNLIVPGISWKYTCTVFMPLAPFTEHNIFRAYPVAECARISFLKV